MDGNASDVKPRIEANVDQIRLEHMHSTFLLTEHFSKRIRELETERDRIRAEGEATVDQAKREYEELSAQITEMSREKAEMEQEWEAQDELRDEIERLEEELLALKQGRDSRDSGLKAWIKTEERLRTEIQELKKRKKALARKYNKLQEKTVDDLAKLQEDVRVANASAGEWRQKYTNAVQERIEVVQRLAPPLALPLEVITIIAGFVAGSNAYGTLASLAATSKTLKQECESVLWETVIWSIKLGDGVEHGNLREEVKRHVKFLVGDETQLPTGGEWPAAFPNLRVTIVKLNPRGRFADVVQHGNYAVALDILQTTTRLTTLSSLLQSILLWSSPGQQPSRCRALDVAQVRIHHNAQVVRGPGHSKSLFVAGRAGLQSVRLQNRVVDGVHVAQQERLETCIRSLSQFLLPPNLGHPNLRKCKLSIQCDHPSDIQTWLRELPTYLDLNPNLRPRFRLLSTHEMRSADFVDIVRSFSAVYEALWDDIYIGRAFADGGRASLFKLSFYLLAEEKVGDMWSRSMTPRFSASITKRPGRRGFFVNANEHQRVVALGDHDDNAVILPTGIYDHHWRPRGGRDDDGFPYVSDSDDDGSSIDGNDSASSY